MKTNRQAHSFPDAVAAAASRLLNGSLREADAVRVGVAGTGGAPLRKGFHSHDGFELFFVWGEAMRFEGAGRPPLALVPGSVLIVPPGLFHMTMDCLPQRQRLRILVMTIEEQGPGGSVALRQGREELGILQALSAKEMAHWTGLMGETPALIARRACQAAEEGRWGRQRALGHVRILLAAMAETIARNWGDRPTSIENKVHAAVALIDSRYYESKLTLATIAATVGASSSHLAAAFRRVTGRSIHQALLDVRLRRGMELLARGGCSVKEVAALTGWSHQFHFSAAFRGRYGAPPSDFL